MTFETQLGHESFQGYEWDSCPRKRDPRESPCTFHHVRAQQEVGNLQSRRGHSPEPDYVSTLILNLHPTEL